MNWMAWDDYERVWIVLTGMILLVGIAHIVVYVLLNKATANSLKVRRAFLLQPSGPARPDAATVCNSAGRGVQDHATAGGGDRR